MDSFKQRTKNEVKKVIVEALEELGLEIEGDGEDILDEVESIDREGLEDIYPEGDTEVSTNVDEMDLNIEVVPEIVSRLKTGAEIMDKEEGYKKNTEDKEPTEGSCSKQDKEKMNVKISSIVEGLKDGATVLEDNPTEEDGTEEEEEKGIDDEEEGTEKEEERKEVGDEEENATGEDETTGAHEEDGTEIEDVEREEGLNGKREEKIGSKPVNDIVERLRKGMTDGEAQENENQAQPYPWPIVGSSSFPVYPFPQTQEPQATKIPQNRNSKTDETDVPEGDDIDSYVYEKAQGSEGIGLPTTKWNPKVSIVTKDDEDEDDVNITEVDEYYSLIPKNPKRGENIYAYAHIKWDEDKNSLVYKVLEPKLAKKDEELLDEIKDIIQSRLDVSFEDLGRIKVKGYLSDKLDEAIEILGQDLHGARKKAIKYYIERDLIDMGKIEPMMQDPNIEEISCDGVGIPIFVYHRNANYGSMETNIAFEDKEELDSYVRGLGQMVGKTVSMANPLVDASLPDGSRLQATLGTDIARKGSNFTIRKFTENPLTPVDLMEFGTIDPRALAYIWMAIEQQKSVLISGGTATGKTTMLNVVSLFIRPEMKIVTIEDTAELRLPHTHWVPEVARKAMAQEGSGEVDMFTLLKESLRQRPDYIIVGEVRGAEAFVLFQQMSTGHPGLATIHAENPERLVNRLTTNPINLPPSLISALDIVIFLRKVRRGGTLLRKIDEIVEVKRYSREEDVPKMNRVLKWDPSQDKLVRKNPSLILKEASRLEGMEEDELRDELEDREKVMRWMVHEGMRNIEDIGGVLSRYYSDKESLMKKITW